MREKIEIYYRPVGKPYDKFDHTFLLYTNSDGEKFIFSGMPESQADDLDYKGEGDGRLWTHCEKLHKKSYDYDYTRNLDSQSVEKYTIAEGSDLSDRWRAVGEVSQKINEANIKYGGITKINHNSNSAVNTALIESGYNYYASLSFFRAPGNLDNLAEIYHGGNDTFIGRLGGDRINGYSGHDTVDYSGLNTDLYVSLSATTYAYGGGEMDILYNIESLIGSSGDDTFSLQGALGTHTVEYIDAGEGVDKISFYGTKEALLIDLEAESATGRGSGTTLVLENFENAEGGSGDDVLLGTDDANVMFGGGGDDELQGRAGNDRLSGGDGDDSLYGGDGDDRLYSGNGDDTLFGEAGDDTLAGGDGSDRLHGGDGDDDLSGGDGDDTLHGGDGDDSLGGGAGDDTLLGEAGSDRLSGGDGNDSLHGGDSDDSLHGGNGDDTLFGDAGDDRLSGFDGDDTLHGGDGNDSLHGGDGDDTLFGDAGGDRLSGGDGSDNLHGGDGNDFLWAHAGDDFLYGGAGDDYLTGGLGDDILDGGAGNDTIICDGGYDIATGGAGADKFLLYAEGSTLVVTDFDMERDALVVGKPISSHADTANGLQCNYANGLTAILEDITASQAQAAGWLM